MMRRRISDELSDTSRKVIMAAIVVIILSAIVFFLLRPVKPDLPTDDTFGAPMPTAPAPSGGG